MAKKFMPQRVFEYGAASIAEMHLLKGVPIEQLAALVANGYKNAYVDDGIEEDWVSVASEAIQSLERFEAPSPAALLRHFQYYTENYDEEGKPRKKRFFGGTWLDKEEQNRNRKQDFIKRLTLYFIGARAGIMPLAPQK